MPSFKLEVVETLARMVEVEAETLEDAVRQTYKAHRNGDIVLDADDLVDINVVPTEEW